MRCSYIIFIFVMETEWFTRLGLSVKVCELPEVCVIVWGCLAMDWHPIQATPFPVRPIQAAPFPVHPIQAAPFPVRPIQATPFPVHPIQATPFPVRPIQAAPFPVHPIQAAPFPVRPIQATPFLVHPIQAAPFPARPIQATPFPVHPIQAAPFPVRPIQAAPFPVRSIQAAPFPVHPMQATPFPVRPIPAAPFPVHPIQGPPFQLPLLLQASLQPCPRCGLIEITLDNHKYINTEESESVFLSFNFNCIQHCDQSFVFIQCLNHHASPSGLQGMKMHEFGFWKHVISWGTRVTRESAAWRASVGAGFWDDLTVTIKRKTIPHQPSMEQVPYPCSKPTILSGNNYLLIIDTPRQFYSLREKRHLLCLSCKCLVAILGRELLLLFAEHILMRHYFNI
uniref:Uncharacterized protein n=1 Tax=Paramormyrops kingsleyae TaxID=1676925 RepID=A0A3B3SJN4_9TELE